MICKATSANMLMLLVFRTLFLLLHLFEHFPFVQVLKKNFKKKKIVPIYLSKSTHKFIFQERERYKLKELLVLPVILWSCLSWFLLLFFSLSYRWRVIEKEYCSFYSVFSYICRFLTMSLQYRRPLGSVPSTDIYCLFLLYLEHIVISWYHLKIGRLDI